MPTTDITVKMGILFKKAISIVRMQWCNRIGLGTEIEVWSGIGDTGGPADVVPFKLHLGQKFSVQSLLQWAGLVEAYFHYYY